MKMVCTMLRRSQMKKKMFRTTLNVVVSDVDVDSWRSIIRNHREDNQAKIDSYS